VFGGKGSHISKKKGDAAERKEKSRRGEGRLDSGRGKGL